MFCFVLLLLFFLGGGAVFAFVVIVDVNRPTASFTFKLPARVRPHGYTV